MPEKCTCGAVPPPDARFCHKCGRPLYDEPSAEPDEPLPPPPPVAPPPPPPIGFGNPVAVRVSLLVAALATMLGIFQLPLAMFFAFVRLLAAGFFSVYLYQRRTGSQLSPRQGARLGWITGIFSFLLATVLLGITIAALAATRDLGAFYREQFRNQAIGGAAMEEALRMLETPAGLGLAIFSTLCVLFVVFACLPMLGGAVGAKVLEKEN